MVALRYWNAGSILTGPLGKGVVEVFCDFHRRIWTIVSIDFNVVFCLARIKVYMPDVDWL
ncbi:hypothetical protein BL253_32785 [Pseudofrankia asymbiotica]|uniref:Uncharacterized protein n=1 Tax=Pseudofrankia asymbiotica TaxID=1834516 RepID=A0A1V2I3J0_9ACTN|nr:hypothetical protein BL253_32785 [Pseudofrankia asymbiotica]